MASRNCAPTNFTAALSEILDDYYKSCGQAIEVGVTKTTKDAKKLVKNYAKDAGFHKGETAKRYFKGFDYKVKQEGTETVGEVGNKSLPGLVHLLEKGHAKIGGGRTNAYPHMEPAFNEAKDELIPNIEKELNKI